MSIQRLIKLAPTAILLAFVGYASASLHGTLPDSGATQAELTKGLDVMVQDLATDSAAALKQVKLRDPFLPAAPAAAEVAARPDAPAPSKADPLAEIVAGLSLDATFIQGRDQLAIIDGRIYKKGQRLVLRGDDESSPTLDVVFVKPTGVILRGDGRNYFLQYPERFGSKSDRAPEAGGQDDAAVVDPAGQAAMFQKLLKSPLGALGKSLIGGAVANPRDGVRSPARARRPSSRSAGP
jgi:hypothetical protein